VHKTKLRLCQKLNALDRTLCQHVCTSYAVEVCFLGAVCGLKLLEHFTYLLFQNVSQLSNVMFDFAVL
jgi:hypothetical protein